MDRQDPKYAAYLNVLHRHLKPAMGCTEPIAIAYASAIAAQTLGCAPRRVRVLVSGNLIKNAKAVTVPNTGGRKGIEVACAAGVVAGRPERELQVIAQVSPEQRARMDALLAEKIIQVVHRTDARIFDIQVEVWGEEHSAVARIADRHTNVVLIRRDGETLLEHPLDTEDLCPDPDESLLTIADIFDFAETCALDDVRPVLDRQIECNTAIAREGLSGKWGAAIGRILLDTYGEDDVRVRAKAYAAAGSDARMSGCELPVVINSGSGNQGITVSVPVVEYARSLGASQEQLYRALVLSNLTAIHLKSCIGCLSAYCGAVSAGSASGAGIAYLAGGNLHTINHTIVNTLAILSGTICDGAKGSCAAKIAASLDAAILGYHMALADKQFRDGEGIVKKGVENTIRNVGCLGRDGMRQTDEEILRIMMN